MKLSFLIALVASALAWPMPYGAQPQSANDRGQGTKRPAERRVALVLGNGAYAISPLTNPVGLAAALDELGFEVITDVNKDALSMRRLISKFGERLRGASVGLFFFAGHGVQVGGVNYLIPIGHQIEREADVRLEAVSADDVLARWKKPGRAST